VTPAGAAEAVEAAKAVPPHVKNIKAKNVRNEQTVVVRYFFKKLPLCGICGKRDIPNVFLQGRATKLHRLRGQIEFT
jgi:hypothetical protein